MRGHRARGGLIPSRVLLGVSGGIAAYKACELLRLFTESGHDVTVVPTANALRFVGAATWEALSGNPVSSDVFDRVDEVRHVRLGRQADLVVVAPATADLVAKAVHGRADDLLTSTLLTATCPVVFAPAMHTEMWRSPRDPGQRRHAARAWRHRRRAGHRATDRCRQRAGPAPGARGDLSTSPLWSRRLTVIRAALSRCPM